MSDDEFDKWWLELCEKIEPGTDPRKVQYAVARRILQTVLGEQSEERSISDIYDE